MINAAIVGLGRWGRNIVNAVQAKSERLRFVRGVVRRPEAASEFAAQHGLDLSTGLADALTDRRVQAVVLATPHSQHVEQIILSAGSGKAVFCEKPLALTRADAERAVNACREAGVALAVGTDKRLWPSMRELKRVVESGVLGEVMHIEGHFSNESSHQFPSPWRDSPAESPGGGMTATGIHVLDAFVNLLGPVRRVQAQLVSRRPAPHMLDTVSAVFEFENGASGVLGTIRVTPFYWRVHVFGDRGSAEALGETELVLRLAGEQPRRQSFEPVGALRLELDAFADAAAGSIPFPVPAAQMIATVAALEAMNKAMESSAAVVVGRSLQ
jgi:predicted dehydrogenase